MTACFDSKHHGKPYYIRHCLKAVDKHLLAQHPPHEFSRPPRSINKHLSYWKAHEFHSWLLFYSLPVLLDHLPSLYLHHFSLLVTAMHILLNAELSHAQLAAAEEMLNLFCSFLPELYGDRFCTANAHALTHMAMYVRLWGPLWTQSAFGFESINGHLRKVIHGISHVIDQMGFSVDVFCILISPLLTHDTCIFRYCCSLAKCASFVMLSHDKTPCQNLRQSCQEACKFCNALMTRLLA